MKISPDSLARIKKLRVSHLNSRLGRFKVARAPELETKEISSLLSLASQISLPDDEEPDETTATHHSIAYDICVSCLELYPKNRGVIQAAYYILSRLGNFPGVELLTSMSNAAVEVRPFNAMALESVARHTENEITLINNSKVVFTDFQHRLYELLGGKGHISFSAPTSAGKSFVLSLDIARNLEERPGSVIVYIVPTRALIRQVSIDLNHATAKYCSEDIAVLTAPILPPDNGTPAATIYVFTQERYMTYLFPAEGQPRVDYLYVDEAHELKQAERGMILHSAISATRLKFPEAKIIFASPLTRNPEFFFAEFSFLGKTTSITEKVSPVSQNLIFLSSVPKKPKLINITLFKDNERIAVGDAEVDFAFRDKTARLANCAYHFTERNETSIVFSSGPKQAQGLALQIAQQVKNPPDNRAAISALLEFIKDHVHPEYLLLDLLPKGVAYHYGHMPSLVRTHVEDLIKSGDLRFVCCTSTLLQGVNLPAKNIFIQTPRESRTEPLSAPDFWNLAGRAGRLKKNFSGNIWCLDVSDWDNNPENGERLSNITSSFRQCVEEDSGKILEFAINRDLPSSGSSAEQAFSKIFAEFSLLGEKIATSHYATVNNRKNLEALDAACAAMETEIHTPREILEKNSSISPWCLERLYRTFVEEPNIGKYIPLHPNQGKGETLRTIFKTIDEKMLGYDNESYKYHGWIATSWMLGDPLIRIFENRIDYLKENKPEEWGNVDERDKKNDIIRETLATLEKTIHFTYVKYTRAYIDVLIVALQARGLGHLAQKIPPIHIFLEFGTCDDVVLSLTSLGLSRTTSILLKRSVAKNWPPVSSRAQMQNLLVNANYKQVLPKLCLKEVEEVVFSAVR